MISLNMKSKVELLNSFNIPRVSQLSQRSNQFNLRTIRYSEEDLVEDAGLYDEDFIPPEQQSMKVKGRVA